MSHSQIGSHHDRRSFHFNGIFIVEQFHFTKLGNLQEHKFTQPITRLIEFYDINGKFSRMGDT